MPRAGSDLRLLLVDDHDLYRAGLRTVLEEQGMTVVAEAASGEQALQLVERHVPDVAVVDMRLPGIDGAETTRRLLRTSSPPRVLVLSVSDEEDDVLAAIEAGAVGYLLKEAGLGDVLDGIRAAAGGRSSLSPAVAATVLGRLRREAPAQPEHPLTRREIAVLGLIAEGKDNAEIAASLEISPKTVKNHISSILGKLGLANRIQAAVWAVRAGLV